MRGLSVPTRISFLGLREFFRPFLSSGHFAHPKEILMHYPFPLENPKLPSFPLQLKRFRHLVQGGTPASPLPKQAPYAFTPLTYSAGVHSSASFLSPVFLIDRGVPFVFSPSKIMPCLLL